MTDKTIQIEGSCCLCPHTIVIFAPVDDRWQGIDHSYLESSELLCPDHAAIQPFMENQCPGCVGSWGDCPLWEGFAFSGGRRDIDDDDHATLQKGICPRRVNGTMVGSRTTGLHEIDLREGEELHPEAGKAVSKAIKEYCERHPAS